MASDTLALRPRNHAPPPPDPIYRPAIASDWIFSYICTTHFGHQVEDVHIFFVLNIFFAVLVCLVYPEPSGRTLKEVDLPYSGNGDRLFVIDKQGVLLPRFRSKMGREVDADSIVDNDFVDVVDFTGNLRREGKGSSLKDEGIRGDAMTIYCRSSSGVALAAFSYLERSDHE